VNDSRPSSYRLRRESLAYACFGACFMLLGAGGGIDSASAGSLGSGLLRLGAAWPLATFFAFRMARVGVFVEQDGIRVRNPLKTEKLPWTCVRGFTLRRSPIGEFGVVELHDGRRIRLWAIQPASRMPFASDRRAELAIGGLNRELEAARSAAAAAWPSVKLKSRFTTDRV
jgi:hypothetical protein